ncbi:MAG: DUF72 domain-containing protein [Calditrichaeota bacterium]|nr:MAG: DUF72 domain-containing protein [Calditrichota bacterium]
MNVHIGTSGWIYPHWRGCFYPEDLPQKSWFEFFAQHFRTVEINNTFYRLPSVNAVIAWEQQAPENFIYAVKASRFITHVKKLKDPEEGLTNFMQTIEHLKDHLGPILFQLPPRWRPDLERFERFLQLLGNFGQHLWVFEFRQDEWFEEPVLDLLRNYSMGFCIHDMAGLNCPKAITARHVYIRFHGSTGAYSGLYGEEALKPWAEFIVAQVEAGHEVYAYFNNDIHGYAVQDAKTLINLVS